MKPDPWKEWDDMPEYDNHDTPEPVITVKFKFNSQESYEEFKNKIRDVLFDGEKPFDGMQRKLEKQTWFPHKEKASKYVYVDEEFAE